MARTIIKAQPTAKRGEVIQIQASIGHPMETGFRPGNDGKLLAQNIIKHFSCSYNGNKVFEAKLFSAISSNPYLSFFVRATESGTLTLKWEGDKGFSQTESLNLSVV